MSTRNRKSRKIYETYLKQLPKGSCQFCKFSKESDQILKSTPLFWVVNNIFPYDVWDTSKIKDHLMLVPKRHVDSIAHFNPKEQLAFMKLVTEYEGQGYSVYARSNSNALKTVIHQHTHLIATDKPLKKYLLFVNKPRILAAK